MISLNPLVTIGIPTFNRVSLLERSIKSALCQNYSPLEIVISDNASTDRTREICTKYAELDSRIRYISFPTNVGAAANFSKVLKQARGEYFMWLGDDDWLDDSYVSQCMNYMLDDSNMSLVCGYPKYYRRGLADHDGKVFQLLQNSWILRVASYYARVTDNGMFYGLMRTAELRDMSIPNVMGGDWHLIANIVSNGRAIMCPTVSVHRELGGATASYKKIVQSLGLPWIQAIFPMGAIAVGAVKSILYSGEAYRKRSMTGRIAVASIVFLIVALKGIQGRWGQVRQIFRHYVSSVVRR